MLMDFQNLNIDSMSDSLLKRYNEYFTRYPNYLRQNKEDLGRETISFFK